MNYKIVSKRPWWWFITGRKWGEVAMTFGDTIYCQEDKLRPDILVHELVHVRQHKESKLYAFYILMRSTLDNDFYEKLEREAKNAQIKYILEHDNRRDDGVRS